MNEALTIVGLFVGGMLASEVGFRLGVSSDAKDEAFARQIDVIRTATFALVAFLVGFAFSGAGSRYVDRLDIIVKEANALGTAWLRADVLPGPHRDRLRAAIKEYTEDRVVLLRSRDQDEIGQRLAKVGDLQGRMWAQALDALKDDGPKLWLVLPPLNDVFDLHTTHLALVSRHLPLPILAAMMATAALCLVLTGFGNGRAGRRFLLLDGVYSGVLAVALWMTIDLDHPRHGLMQLNTQPLVDTLAAMKLS